MSASFPKCYVLTTAMRQFLQIATLDTAPKFIVGATGTGKGLLAELIHAQGPRASKPFVSIGCAALQPTLAHSQLFGHVKGSFTGAQADKDGFFHAADGGTVVLNELDALDLSIHAQLLDYFDTGTINRLGSTAKQKVDVQVIITTSLDPARLLAAGRLREDFYARTRTFRFACPPYECRDDVADIASAVLTNVWMLNKRESPAPTFTEDALAVIASYRFWPQNVRCVEQLVRLCLVRSGGPTIDADLVRTMLAECRNDWEESASHAGETPRKPKYARQGSPEDERLAMEEALRETAGNVTRAASLCGMCPATFKYKAKQHGIRSSDFRTLREGG